MGISLGLLPLWLKLYDECCADTRPQVEAFVETICLEYKNRNIEVVTAPLCRLKPEFSDAINTFETANVDVIITLHLAYSPSLESSNISSPFTEARTMDKH